MPKVIVVGSGYAGVSAATALAEQGIPVNLLESRGSLGGRVYSIPPSESFPAPVDNGPHLLMGCYRETLRLFDRLRVSDPIHWIDPLSLSWLLSNGKKASLRCANLPAPMHLAMGLLFSNAFPLGEKISLALALRAFSEKPFVIPAGVQTVAQYLDASSQGPQTRERFWIPLCNSVMNIAIEKAPIRGLGEVLNRIFFGTRRDSALGVVAKPLSEVAFPQVAGYLSERGGSLQLSEGIQEFKVSPKGFSLVSRSGKTFSEDALVWAVPPSSLSALWPKGPKVAMKDLSKLGKSPIISVHVILSQSVTNEHFVGLSGATFDWVFNRNANWNWKGEGYYLSFTASAAENLASLKDPELLELAMGELQVRCPAARQAQVLHSKVTREMAATFQWTLETDSLRPPCDTPFPHVFLAGDWTSTSLPATIEGACQSGHLAAEKVKAFLTRGNT